MKYIRTSITFLLICMLLIVIAPTDAFLNPIVSFFNFIFESAKQVDEEPPDQLNLLSEYDFIVVGAGTAGCVIANRLSEVSEWKVLLVEAGTNEHFIMDIPIVANYIQFTDANWKYYTKPSDKYCAGFKNKQCHWPRGKVMGGSSVLNYMIYTRGTQQDYDNWRDLGNNGWGWNDVLPYFKKVEDYKIPEFSNSEYHGTEGHVNIEQAPFRTPVSEAWVKSSKELGFPYGDFNGPKPASVSFLQLSLKNGTRHSSSRAYLHSVKKRKNLHVSKASMVTKLLFNDSNTKVIGVVMEKFGVKHTIFARKEVVVSAGAINSPQLLMLSGIGPKSHLESKQIGVIKDLQVGYNLMDHIAAGGLQFVVNPQKFSLNTANIISHPSYVFQWMKSHTGPLSIPGGCEALLFTELNNKFNATAWPDFELLFIGGSLNSDPLLSSNFNFDMNIYSETFGPLGDNDAFMVFPMLMRPKSRGRIELQSRNPYEHPILTPNYFDVQEDINKMVQGMRLAIEVSKQPSLKKEGAKLYDVPIKECLKYGPFGSDEYFACHARMFTFTIYHQSGTCKMGPETDHTSVVDARMKVHGMKNLRVIDASIMPEIVSSHPNAAVFMIAEKGSDMIKEDWKMM